MAEKYYITNGTSVIGSVAGKAFAPVEGSKLIAARFKHDEGLRFIQKNLHSDIKWCLQRVFDTNSKKNYIITTATTFAADKGTITNQFKEAKSFRNPAEAETYIKNHRELAKSFGKPLIVNDNLEEVERSAHLEFSDEQLELIGANKPVNRPVLSKTARLNIYNRSDKCCSICGKPLRYNEMSVDHIVPLSRGGENENDNLRCTCTECNKLKGDRLDSEMYQGLSNIVARGALQDPDNEAWMMVLRGVVRGTITKYKNNVIASA